MNAAEITKRLSALGLLNLRGDPWAEPAVDSENSAMPPVSLGGFIPALPNRVELIRN